MRTKTKTITLYQFSELSDSAKERAISDWRNDANVDTSYNWDEARKSVDEFCDEFGVKTSSRSWLDFDSLTNYRDQATDTMTGNRLRTYILNNFSSVLTERKHYGPCTKQPNGKYGYSYLSKCQFIDTCCPFTGVCWDEDLLAPIRKFIKTGDKHMTYDSLMTECLETLRISLDNEDEYKNSAKGITEDLEANEYEFTEDGERQ